MSVKKSAAVLGVAAIALVSLTACSSSGSESSTAAATASVVGGMTECSDQAVGDAINKMEEAEGAKLIAMNTLECADGWAVANATTGTDDEGSQIANVIILQQEGQFWVPQDRVKVCGTADDAASAAPADATIPASLWQVGCTTD